MTCSSARTSSVNHFLILTRSASFVQLFRYAGHWLFTQLLLPTLFAATDASSTHEKARIVTVSSSANYLTTGIDFDAIADGPERTKYGEWELYNKSKFVRRTKILPTLFLTDPVAG